MFQPPTTIDWSGSAATATEFYDVSTPQEIRRPKRRAGAADQAPGPMEDSTTLQAEKWADVMMRHVARVNMRAAMRIRCAEGMDHVKDLQRRGGPMFKMVPGS